ncbi:hypothetical protein D3C72_2322750 [compost metagenome]
MHLDAGMGGLEGGDQRVVERVLLGRVAAIAVRAPEGDRDVLGEGGQGDEHGGCGGRCAKRGVPDMKA